MPIFMMAGLAPRVIQVLKDYLPTETGLLDNDLGDGLTTPTIPDDAYFDNDQRLIDQHLACAIRAVSSDPVELHFENTGRRVRARHHVEVLFHISIAVDDDAAVLEKYLFRYVTGAVRTLCVMHPTLDTSADPNPYAEIVRWDEPATYGPDEDQGTGSEVRTATLPIAIEMIEVR